ncbi:MAG TPA: hypothetical protein VHY37_11165 [Tepidisphaeraceae bacterium]|nr:hypothetical protein [Tepidisphaeraceae bacterium]
MNSTHRPIIFVLRFLPTKGASGGRERETHPENKAHRWPPHSCRTGRLDKAIDHLAQQAPNFPKAPSLWGYLGLVYNEAGDQPKAQHAFRIAARLSPHSEQASLGLFHSLWHQGKTNAAFNEMRRFVKSNDSPRYRQLIRDMLADGPGGPAAPNESLVVA